MRPNNRRRVAEPEPAPLPAAGWITAVTAQARNPRRVNLFVDGEFVLGLDAELAVRLGLARGREVDRRLLEEARDQDAGLRARSDALAFLAPRPRTRQEVERRLARRGYEPGAVAAAIAYLEARGYVNDAEYCQLYIRQRLEGRDPPGRRRLESELMRRGVALPLVRAALDEALDGSDPAAAAVALLRRRLERGRPTDRAAAYRRLAGLLARRGYDPETIRRAVQAVLGEWEPLASQESDPDGENPEGSTPRRTGLARRRPWGRSRQEAAAEGHADDGGQEDPG